MVSRKLTDSSNGTGFCHRALQFDGTDAGKRFIEAWKPALEWVLTLWPDKSRLSRVVKMGKSGRNHDHECSIHDHKCSANGY
jgi:hypothetical protein